MLNPAAASAFIAIATTGSFTEAARQLALSKSAVSDRLQELERSLATNARGTKPVLVAHEDQKLIRPIAGLNRPGDGAESR